MSIYNNFRIVGDFNSEVTGTAMHDIFEMYHNQHLLENWPGFENPVKSTCIDLILTVFSRPFMNLKTIKIALWGFVKLTRLVFKFTN